MEHLRTIEYPFPDVSEDLTYRCPCSKTYKSYSALYTHIKNKHQGKAPGPIGKPNLPQKKRGRPAVNKSRTSLDNDHYLPSDSNIAPSLLEIQESSTGHQNVTPQECLNKIARILDNLPIQAFNKSRLNEISAVTQMIVFMSTRNQQGQNAGIIGMASQFLQLLSKTLTWQKSKSFFILFMVFLQYIIDHCQQVNNLRGLPVDTLCEYINEFVQDGAEEMSQALQISELAVFESGTMMAIFSWFFRWLFLKNYSTYRIVANQKFKRHDTRPQF